jgi:hypothetical protein
MQAEKTATTTTIPTKSQRDIPEAVAVGKGVAK